MGLGLQQVTPAFVWPSSLEVPGVVLAALGLLLMLVSVGVFWSRRTSIQPNRPATEFVVVGPYKFTRNPMYLGMSLVHLGLSLAFGPVWPVVFLPVAMVLVVRFVIRREEEYLLRTFGASYEEYCSRVRRWI